MGTDGQSDARLRPHPTKRFAPPQIAVDLNAIVGRLRGEPRTGESGHRQETLYKDGSLTIALFLFDRFTGLKEHRATGIVNIHVLRGTLTVTAEEQVHELQAGHVLLLASGVSHTLRAEEETEMLLTVRLSDR